MKRSEALLPTILIVLVAASVPAFSVVENTAVQAQELSGEGNQSPEAVEKILEQQEQLLRGQQFSYDPEDRRDPFRSLFAKVEFEKERPPGVSGMLVDEIDLAGIVQDGSGGDVAFFTGSDNKGYFMRVGERVYDGTLIAIDARKGAVTFRQQIDDPRQIKPYRDVIRRLATLDEENTP